jgi:hypothetical protein
MRKFSGVDGGGGGWAREMRKREAQSQNTNETELSRKKGAFSSENLQKLFA